MVLIYTHSTKKGDNKSYALFNCRRVDLSWIFCVKRVYGFSFQKLVSFKEKTFALSSLALNPRQVIKAHPITIIKEVKGEP